MLLVVSTTCSAWNWWPIACAKDVRIWNSDIQRDTLLYIGELSGNAGGGSRSPWMMQYDANGHVSSEPYSGNLTLGIRKPSTRPIRWFDYDGAVLLTGRLQSGERLGTGYFRELYAHVRLYIVDVTVGIKPMENAFGDKELTMGDLLISDNTHPIPRVTIGLDHYTPFPGLYGYLEIRGGLTHGWLNDNNDYVKKTLLHHKFAGARIGGRLPVNIAYEIHHAAQWGGTDNIYGDLGNDWSAFKNVFMARSGGKSSNETINAQGNHIVSQTLCLTAKGKRWRMDIYWQNLSEDGPLRFIGWTMNAADGRWGLHLSQNRWPFLSAFTLECIQTTDQSGPFHDRDGLVFGGNDGYYANSIYRQGWTYYGRVIGNGLMSPDDSRVIAGYIGLKGDIYGFRYRLAGLHSRHFGTYQHPNRTRNTSLMLDIKKRVEQAWGLEFGLRLSADIGNKWGNNYGAMVTITKSGLIKEWH